MALLEANGIRKVFGELTALDGAELRVESNQFHGLIGPNGSGKTTLLKCIAGAEKATAGAVIFRGNNITNNSVASRARGGMSLKFQITSVFDVLSVYDNVLLSLQADQSPWSLICLILTAINSSRIGCAYISCIKFVACVASELTILSIISW